MSIIVGIVWAVGGSLCVARAAATRHRYEMAADEKNRKKRNKWAFLTFVSLVLTLLGGAILLFGPLAS